MCTAAERSACQRGTAIGQSMNRRNFMMAAGTATVFMTSRAAAAEPAGRGQEPRDTIGEDAAAAFRYTTERRFLETPSGRIAYIDRGTGRPTLLLHGFPLNSFQWRG